MIDRFVGIIYWSDGTREEVSHWSGGAGTERSCERDTAMQFEQKKKLYAKYPVKPTRFEVKKVS